MSNLNDEDKVKKEESKIPKKEEKEEKKELTAEEKLKDTEDKLLRSLAELENQRNSSLLVPASPSLVLANPMGSPSPSPEPSYRPQSSL